MSASEGHNTAICTKSNSVNLQGPCSLQIYASHAEIFFGDSKMQALQEQYGKKRHLNSNCKKETVQLENNGLFKVLVGQNFLQIPNQLVENTKSQIKVEEIT